MKQTGRNLDDTRKGTHVKMYIVHALGLPYQTL